MTDFTDGVLLNIENAIATITLNTPARHNSFSAQGLKDFRRAVDYVATKIDDREVRVLILTGNGEKTFCSGASLDDLAAGKMTEEDFPSITEALAALPIPKICALNGSVYGGGTELALCCDFRIGVEKMRMFVPPARIGLCYPYSGIRRFVQQLGPSNAKRVLIASEEFDEHGLLTMGFLTHLSSREALQDDAASLAEKMAGYGPLAVQAMLAISNAVISGELDEAKALQQQRVCSNSKDLQEGLQANQEKRKPIFTGA